MPPFEIACVDRSAAIEDRHLAEHRARLENGERFLAAARHVAADADFAAHDQIEPVAVLAFAEDEFARDERLFLAHLGDLRELGVVEVAEDHDLLQQLGDFSHEAESSWTLGVGGFVAGGPG